MAIGRSISPKIYRSNGNILKNSTDYKFPIQIAPPLSLQQYARSFATIPGAEQWHPSGIYHPPTYHSYLSRQVRKQPDTPQVKPWIYAYRRKYSIPTYSLKHYKDIKPKPSEPIWYPPSPYIAKRPSSLSPEKRWQKSIHEPIWQPNGTMNYKPIPYFDPPNLRWSLQQLLKTVPDFKTKPSRISLTKSQYVKDF
jgi:hypothetical protein